MPTKISDAILEQLDSLLATLIASPTTVVAFILAVPLFHEGTRRFLETWWEKMKVFFLQHSTSSTGGPKVSEIYIYPVKSLRAVELKEAIMDECGIDRDRRLMLVVPNPPPVYGHLRDDPTHKFLTQRQCPQLATVTAQYLSKDLLRLSVDKQKKSMTFHLSFDSDKQPILKSRLWDNVVEVVDMGDAAADFVQAIVGDDIQNVRLTRMLQPSLAKDAYVPPSARTWLGTTPQVALTDGFPILIACEASLQEVNRRLKQKGKEPIPMSRFRPNIVIANTKTPFEEDSWKVISIGNTIFHLVKGCPRCKQSCTDQQTGQVHDEPLSVLSEFRAVSNTNTDDVYFAQNAIASSGTTVKQGDIVKILKRGNPVWDREDVQAE
jgi:uncharacterized protein YcbX